MNSGRFEDLYLPGVGGNVPSGVRMGDLVYITGLEPVSRSSSGGEDDIRQQAREILERMSSALDATGGSIANIGRATAYMTSPGSQRETVYDVWEAMFPDASDKPAFKVLNAELPLGILLRLDLVAVLGQRRARFDIPNVDARDPTVRIGDLVFTSRLHGTSPVTGKTVEGLEAQARQALANGIKLVELAGGSREDVTQITAFGRDLSCEPVLRAVIAERFTQRVPVLHPLVTFIRPELEVMVEFTASLTRTP